MEGQTVAEKHGVKYDEGRFKRGVVCRHHSGGVYTILHVANEAARHPDKNPPCVVYMGTNGCIWTQPLSEFRRENRPLYTANQFAPDVIEYR